MFPNLYKTSSRFQFSLISLARLGLILIFNLFLFASPINAQTDCDCYFETQCEVESQAIGPARSGNTNGTMFCAGIRGNHNVPFNPGDACYILEPCGKTCTECVPGAAVPGAEQDSLLCSVGALCEKQTPQGWVGEKGLWSTLFKTCYCGYAELIQEIMNIGFSVVGALSLAGLSIGAFQYITAKNDPEKLQQAKGTLTAAIAGAMLVLLSVVIMRFLGGELEPWGIRFLEFPE